MSSNSKENSNSKKKYKKNALDYVDFFKEFKKDSKFKTELCSTFSETGFCPYGNKCRFAHGKDELFERSVNHPNYRRSDCNAFHSNGYCNYGIRCHFRHYENKEIENTPRSYYTYLLKLYDDSTFLEKRKFKRLKIFEYITGEDKHDYIRRYNKFKESLDCKSFSEPFPVKLEACKKSLSSNNFLNFNVNNVGVLNNLNSKDVVSYFELMNKLTKMINFNNDKNNSEMNSMYYTNTMIPLVYNSKSPVETRKVSVNSINSPNTSSISSADSLTVAKKGKNFKKVPNHKDSETSQKVSLM